MFLRITILVFIFVNWPRRPAGLAAQRNSQNCSANFLFFSSPIFPNQQVPVYTPKDDSRATRGQNLSRFLRTHGDAIWNFEI
jgi:hypothetical protein